MHCHVLYCPLHYELHHVKRRLQMHNVCTVLLMTIAAWPSLTEDHYCYYACHGNNLLPPPPMPRPPSPRGTKTKMLPLEHLGTVLLILYMGGIHQLEASLERMTHQSPQQSAIRN